MGINLLVGARPALRDQNQDSFLPVKTHVA
jgi:hypothetical protein